MATIVTLGLADPLSFTAWPTEPLQAGKPVTLRWTGGAHPDQPVTITLREGPSGNLRDVKVITDQAKDGSFTWTPDSDVKGGQTYAFQISQQDEMNYTALLHSAGNKPADTPEDKASTTGTTGTTTGAATTPAASKTTGGTQTTDVASSKALISSSASGSATPSSSAVASSSITSSSDDVPMITDISNGKEASSTGSVQTDAGSITQSSMKFVLGVAGLLVYLVQ
ncbi:hypothetical protein PENANT_c003G01757 [Penicillium antarcticum]|uniref:Yeast cell wall synthesis Kre9/Knh1-like N-terminal domain-containing protein n=2 Tax=Penicillium antarcticum TaxID=416450 RepID=A0A1V6QI45_9EURO|nr:hypothetical protein PENANT_c003G01757 [Penicillium antarcticum]